MISKIVRFLVNQLVENNQINIAQQEEYTYSLMCLFEEILTTGSLLLLGLAFGNLLPTIAFLLSFFSLRKRTGGFHLNTFKGCYGGTIILYFVIVVISKYMVKEQIILGILTVLSSGYILLIGTVNHPNIAMDEGALTLAKESARLLNVLLLMLVGFLWWIEANIEVIVYICLAIILCAVLLIVAKLLRQEVRE